jgi:hypothetical protein
MQGQQQKSFGQSAEVVPQTPEQPREPAPATPAGSRVVWRRMLRVLKLDRSVYADVERDPAGTRQAARVVAFVAAFAALGTVLIEAWHPGAILGAILAALIHWLLWSGLIYLIASVLYRKPVSLVRLVRALGYAQTPQLFAIFAFVPVVGTWIVLGSRLLTIIAGNLAIGDAFGLSLRQTIAIRLLSFGIAFAAAAGVRAVLGDVGFVTALLRP